MNGARVKRGNENENLYIYTSTLTHPQMVGGTRSYEMARRMVHAGSRCSYGYKPARNSQFT